MAQMGYIAMLNQVQQFLRSLDSRKQYSKRDVIDVAVEHFNKKYPGFNSNAFILNCCSKMNND